MEMQPPVEGWEPIPLSVIHIILLKMQTKSASKGQTNVLSATGDSVNKSTSLRSKEFIKTRPN